MTTAHLFAFNATIAAELKDRITDAAFNEPLKWTPSKYQQGFFDWLGAGRGSCILKAVAGSGKTTSIIAGLRHIGGLTARDVRASTFHSVGFAAVLKKLNLRHGDLKPDGKKVEKLARLVLTERELDLYEAFAVKLVGLAKGEGLGAIVAGTETAWNALVAHHDLSLDADDATEAEGIEVARKLLRFSNELARPQADRRMQVEGAPAEPTIDFDDMLYLTLLWKCRLWQDDVVFVDEAQDTNPVRRAIAKLKLKPGGRLIAVGDPHQAIYGFTGASADAMDLIAKEFSCVELPLTVSYRCPRSVAEKVKALVPYFEVPETAEEGSVKSLALRDAMPLLSHRDAIVCRNTAPLVSLALSLIASGTPCHVLGREIGAGLVAFIKKIGSRGMGRFLERLEAHRVREVAKHVARGEELKAAGVEDKVACVLAIVDAIPEQQRTVPELVRRVEGMFADDQATLSLATVHKVKGKEYDNVAVLCPELMPSKWARQRWQVAAEDNLMYVAWTRTKNTLIFLTDATICRATYTPSSITKVSRSTSEKVPEIVGEITRS